MLRYEMCLIQVYKCFNGTSECDRTLLTALVNRTVVLELLSESLKNLAQLYLSSAVLQLYIYLSVCYEKTTAVFVSSAGHWTGDRRPNSCSDFAVVDGA